MNVAWSFPASHPGGFAASSPSKPVLGASASAQAEGARLRRGSSALDAANAMASCIGDERLGCDARRSCVATRRTRASRQLPSRPPTPSRACRAGTARRSGRAAAWRRTLCATRRVRMHAPRGGAAIHVAWTRRVSQMPRQVGRSPAAPPGLGGPVRHPRPLLHAHAAAMRAAPTTSEALLWEALRGSQLGLDLVEPASPAATQG